MATATTKILNDRVIEFEEAIVEAVATIDQADGSRLSLQEAIDSVRQTLGDAYGDSLTDDVNEHLGVETSDDELEENDDDQ